MPSSLIKQASARLSRRSCPPGLAIILAGQLVLVPDPHHRPAMGSKARSSA